MNFLLLTPSHSPLCFSVNLISKFQVFAKTAIKWRNCNCRLQSAKQTLKLIVKALRWLLRLPTGENGFSFLLGLLKMFFLNSKENPPSAFIVLLVLHFGKLFLCNCFAGKTLTMLGLSLPLRWPLPRVFNLKQVRVSLELVVFEFLYGKRCQNYFISFIYSNSLILQFNFKLKYIRKFAGLSLSHFCVVTNCFLL